MDARKSAWTREQLQDISNNNLFHSELLGRRFACQPRVQDQGLELDSDSVFGCAGCALEHFDRCMFFLLAFLSPGSRDLHGPFGQQSLLREATWLESSFSDHWNWYYANERADLTQVIPSCHRLHLIAVSSRHLHSPQVSGVHNVDHACLRSNQSYSLRRRPVYV